MTKHVELTRVTNPAVCAWNYRAHGERRQIRWVRGSRILNLYGMSRSGHTDLMFELPGMLPAGATQHDAEKAAQEYADAHVLGRS